MSQIGATIRRLRVESGLSLRDLAKRLGVSSAYLSRVEHGLDAVPTAQRLEALATAFDVAPDALLETGMRVSSSLERYLEQEPFAGALLLRLASMEMSSGELNEVLRFAQRNFGDAAAADAPAMAVELSPLLHEDTILLGMYCEDIGDALALVVPRMTAQWGDGAGTTALIAALQERLDSIDASISADTAVLCLRAAIPRAVAACVSFEEPTDAGLATAMQTLVLIVLPETDTTAIRRVAHVARLARRGLSSALQSATSTRDARHRIADLEGLVD